MFFLYIILLFAGSEKRLYVSPALLNSLVIGY